MSWSKLITEAASKYLEERGVTGAIEDLSKISSFVKNNFLKAGSQFSTCINGNEEIDYSSVIPDWLESFMPEMNSCYSEAKRQDVLSKEFEENIQFVLETGYCAIRQLVEIDEELTTLGEYANEIDSICDRALELVFNKCRGTMENNVTSDYIKNNINKTFSMEVKGVYPVNFDYGMTMITGIIKSGKISTGKSLTLPSGESAQVQFIQMFGVTLNEAECGDTCAVILEGDYYNDIQEETPFVIDNTRFEEGNDSNINTSSVDVEQEYIDELKACLEDDNVISDRERRLLNKVSQSLGISEERAKELELSLQKSINLTPEEQEYANEIKACLEDDGEISSKERRLLNKLRNSLGIDPTRAEEIEANLKK